LHSLGYLLSILGLSTYKGMTILKYFTIAIPSEIFFSMVWGGFLLKRSYNMVHILSVTCLVIGCVLPNAF
jgi:drug/metabolite transporter (DMT)-like permease